MISPMSSVDSSGAWPGSTPICPSAPGKVTMVHCPLIQRALRGDDVHDYAALAIRHDRRSLRQVALTALAIDN
jgi:hypothetical protein